MGTAAGPSGSATLTICMSKLSGRRQNSEGLARPRQAVQCTRPRMFRPDAMEVDTAAADLDDNPARLKRL